MSDAINPYQPPSTPVGVDEVGENEFSFRLTGRNLNHGQSHHLIRCRWYSVMLVSIGAIVASLVVILFAFNFFGSSQALFVMPFTMGLSAAAYLAVTAAAKRRTIERMTECGFVRDATVTVYVDSDDLVAKADGEPIHWNRADIKCYRTPRGIIVVPEQYVYFFLPSRGQFNPATYKTLSKMFLSGNTAESPNAANEK